MKFEINEVFLIVLLFFGILFASSLNTLHSDIIKDVLDNSFAKLKSSFYGKSLINNYNFYRYDWARGSQFEKVTAVHAEKNMTLEDNVILIDNEFPINARGATFFIAESKDGKELPFVRAAVIMTGENSTNGLISKKRNFSMGFYDSYNKRKNLECCEVYDVIQKKGYSVYYIKCGLIW
ncbi:MAG: hypothetical protein QW255_00260 [Candidatus Bilamarchaeaceae archaeon]